MAKHLLIIFPISILFAFLVLYFIGPASQEVTSQLYLALNRGLGITVFTLILAGIPAGIYWLAKKKEIPKVGILAWGLWCFVLVFSLIPALMRLAGAGE